MLPINHFWRGAHAQLRHRLPRRHRDPGASSPSREDAGEDPRGDAGTAASRTPRSSRSRTRRIPNTYLLRFGAVSPVIGAEGRRARGRRCKHKFGADAVHKFEFSEGGDKIYVRFDQDQVEPSEIADGLQGAGRAEQHRAALRPPRGQHLRDHPRRPRRRGADARSTSKLGAGAVKAIPSVESVGAKAGTELRDDGIKSLLVRHRLHHGLHRGALRLPLRPGHRRRRCSTTPSWSWARSPSPTASSRSRRSRRS